MHYVRKKVAASAISFFIAVIAGAMPSAALAQASTVLKSFSTGACSYPATASAGALIQTENCNASNRQLWATEIVDGFTDSDTIKRLAFRLKNIESGLCLDLISTSTANGVQLSQRACNATGSQQWRYAPIQYNGNVVIVIKNRYSNKCIDLPAQGGPLQQWDCGGALNQQWWVPNYTR